jgi:hypothetical protein
MRSLAGGASRFRSGHRRKPVEDPDGQSADGVDIAPTVGHRIRCVQRAGCLRAVGPPRPARGMHCVRSTTVRSGTAIVNSGLAQPVDASSKIWGSAVLEVMPSFGYTLRRWYPTVRGLMNRRLPMSTLDRPSRASQAIWVSCGVSSAVLCRPVALSSRALRSAKASIPIAANSSWATRKCSRAEREPARRGHGCG